MLTAFPRLFKAITYLHVSYWHELLEKMVIFFENNFSKSIYSFYITVLLVIATRVSRIAEFRIILMF